MNISRLRGRSPSALARPVPVSTAFRCGVVTICKRLGRFGVFWWRFFVVVVVVVFVFNSLGFCGSIF